MSQHKVFVYKNLNKNMWSIRAEAGPAKGKVIGHAHYVRLYDCKFRVSEAGRQRVLRTKQKNVHAGVVGILAEEDIEWTEVGQLYLKDYKFVALHRDIGGFSYRVSYNPYANKKFFAKDLFGAEIPGSIVVAAKEVIMDTNGTRVVAVDPTFK